ncbi:P-loop ATPase, Sll1717 family [Stenotrophomonas acidaminiphila]|uniref:P-loop ATPase, Sll1717 family n=2 Tax=Gammaproteobacteria TaxID=1236 RepID=UPI003D08F375
MRNDQITSLTPSQVDLIRRRWFRDSSFIGYPNAERDSAQEKWYEHLLVQPDWFVRATSASTTVAVARKGAGKSAVRIASMEKRRSDAKTLIVSASADELASLHADRLARAANRGYGAVSDWMQIYADLIVRHLARDMSGTLLTSDDEIAIRAWAKTNGITERDFGERIVDAIKTLVPWARKLASENEEQQKESDERITRVVGASDFVLYVDDFDNLQEKGGAASVTLVRDAIEAADRITHSNRSGEVHLFVRQDLWLNINPGWHYSDKVSGVVHLNWDVGDLRKWTQQRLRFAVGTALGLNPRLVNVPFDDMWHVFFPPEVRLKNKTESDSFSYLVRRSMYTPRSLQSIIKFALDGADRLPVSGTVIEEAEWSYSTGQLEFLKTEFGSLCIGLDICLQSFTGKPLEWVASELYKHLRGLLGNGQVRLHKDVSYGEPDIALARFLYRIGFLEVRYPQDGRYEVRDVMRHPDHWKSIRTDDAVRWAVRSAFFNGLKSFGR